MKCFCLPFQILDRVRAEVRLLERLRASGLRAPDVAALAGLRSAAPAGASGGRLDLLAGRALHRITWLNDLEKDRKYRMWPQAVQTVLQVGGARALRCCCNMLPWRADSWVLRCCKWVMLGLCSAFGGFLVCTVQQVGAGVLRCCGRVIGYYCAAGGC